MTADEIRVRLIEAASKFPNSHPDGFAAGVLSIAREWEAWVIPNVGTLVPSPTVRPPLGLPEKKR